MKSKIKHNKYNLIAFLLFAALIAIILLSFSLLNHTSNRLSEKTVDTVGEFYLKEIADRATSSVSALIENKIERLQAGIEIEKNEKVNISPSEIKEYLNNMEKIENLKGIVLIGNTGKVYGSDGGYSLYDNSNAITSETGISKIVGKIGTENILTVTFKVNDFKVGRDSIICCTAQIQMESLIDSRILTPAGENSKTYTRLYSRDGYNSLNMSSGSMDSSNIFERYEQTASFEDGFSIEKLKKDWANGNPGYAVYETEYGKSQIYYEPVEGTNMMIMCLSRQTIIDSSIVEANNEFTRIGVEQTIILIILFAVFSALIFWRAYQSRKQRVQSEHIIEITNLNSELEERQAQLEESTTEQEQQIEEITRLNAKLSSHSEFIQKQFAFAEAVSRDTKDIFLVDIDTNTSKSIKLNGVMLEEDKQTSREYNTTWDWYIKKHVNKDDAEGLRNAVEINNICKELADKTEYIYRFRIIVNGQDQFYQVGFNKIGDEDLRQFVFSFRCIDDVINYENEQRKQLEEANATAEERLEEIEKLNKQFKEKLDIIANTGYGIWQIVMKQDGNNEMIADNTLQEILGVSGMNLSPEELYVYYHGRLLENVSEIEDEDYSKMADGSIKVRVLEYNHPTKGKIILNAGGKRYDGDDTVIMISGYCGDITQQRDELANLNRNLEAALEDAAKANKAKTDFLFSMSHDIRTPMNAIMGYNQLIKRDINDPEKIKDYQHKMEQASEFLLDLINNVLDMARIESGKMEVDNNYAYVDETVKEIEDVYETAARDKNLNIEFLINVEHPHIMCDTVKVKEIFSNLISNAIKYTPSGGKIKYSITEQPCDDEGYVLLETKVEDTGIGMSQEFMQELFEAFTRERNTTYGKVAGTGLGLSIVKKLVDLMGGTIDVQSELGKGTVFTVKLKHKIADEQYYHNTRAEQSTAENSQCELTGKHILLAEDNELNAEIAIAILEDTGLNIDWVGDGIECVNKIEQMPPNTYDAILMDIQMPNMDGYKATQAIRRLPDKVKAEIPIIAMTANAFEEDKKNAFAAGMNGHVAKPIQIDILKEALLSVL